MSTGNRAALRADTLSAMSRPRTHSMLRAIVVVATVAATGAGLTACGAGDPSGKKPTESGSASPSNPKSSSPSSPASDQQIANLDGAQFSAPADWKVSKEGTTYVFGSPKDESGAGVGSGIFDAEPTLALSTEDLAKESQASLPGKYTKVERLKDENFGGTTFFHIRGSGESQTFDLYGALVGDIQVEVGWYFTAELATRKQIDVWINQVMPTFTFKG